MSHTKGPWKYCKGNANRFPHVHIGGPGKCDDMVGRLVVNEPTMTSGADYEANARLIAAAPDMLQALKGAMFALGRAGANVPDGLGRAEWEAARAAIAKAEGLAHG